MTKEEYKAKLKAIEEKFDNEKYALYREFALGNAKFKIGDTIKDERWVFTIDKITVSKLFDIPEPVYHGFELKKDLKPRKDLNRVTIYGNDAQLINIPPNQSDKSNE